MGIPLNWCFSFVCVYGFGYTGGEVGQVAQRANSYVFFYFSLAFIFETGPFTYLPMIQLNCLAEETPRVLCFYLPRVEVTDISYHTFYVGAENLNSYSHGGVTNTSPVSHILGPRLENFPFIYFNWKIEFLYNIFPWWYPSSNPKTLLTSSPTWIHILSFIKTQTGMANNNSNNKIK